MDKLQDVPIGNDIKMEFALTACGFSMQDDDFTVRAYVSRKKVVEKDKRDLPVNENNGKYIFAFNSEDVGVGICIFEAVAYVPDDDFDDGFRTEIVRQNICRVIR